ncbi:hypothetical protein [Hymenobacter tenuis]
MNPTEFFKRSLCDAKGNPDGKLLTLFGLSAAIMASYPIGWLTGRWLPDAVFDSTLLFLAAGFGIDAFVTRSKILAEAQVATAELTGQAPATPVGATTTTTTTLTPE